MNPTEDGFEITTEDQARNWILEQLGALETVRAGCNHVIAGDKQATVKFQQSAYRKFITKHGGVLGMLAVLYRCGKLGMPAYDMLRTQTMALLGPSLIVGRYDWFTHVASDGLTEDRARDWVLEQLGSLKEARADCNVYFPGDADKTVRFQQAAERRFLVKHGCVLGMLFALLRCRLLSDVGYTEMRVETMALLGPTVVGEFPTGARAH